MQETSINFGSDWCSLSLRPVQKNIQLEMLLKRLLKKIPKDHPDRWSQKDQNAKKSNQTKFLKRAFYRFGPGQHREMRYRFCRGFWWKWNRRWKRMRQKRSRRMRQEKVGAASEQARLPGPSESDSKVIQIRLF